MLNSIATRANGLLDQSQALWQLWMDWELRLLAAADGEEKWVSLNSVTSHNTDSGRKEQMARIHEMYLERLAVPQATLDATSSAYSTFLSDHCPEEYEARMIQITEVSQPAKTKWATERRHGKMRADFEEQLVSLWPIQTQTDALGIQPRYGTPGDNPSRIH